MLATRYRTPYQCLGILPVCSCQMPEAPFSACARKSGRNIQENKGLRARRRAGQRACDRLTRQPHRPHWDGPYARRPARL